jgi:hypothetical protein
VGISTGIGAAHAGTARLGIREIVRQLNGALGATLVAALAGARDPKISYKWARTDGPEPKPGAQARLMPAHRAWTAVAGVEGEHMARMWFVGANPWLGEISPIQAISRLEAKKVMDAAAAMTDDRFAG